MKRALNAPQLYPWTFEELEEGATLIPTNIVVHAYIPSGNNVYDKPEAVNGPVVIEIVEKLGQQPAQMLIQWAIQRGTVVLPKSVTHSRIDANFQDFELPQDAFEKINALDCNVPYNLPARLDVVIFGERGR
ncbi:NADP-dependent oxidoreductase domain-containing protein [Xylariaceae sp. AK1471]|nr:NADP-dependent oxidoreductase domain-containing protein [Xylariaceae sp. AK1471]